MKMSRHTAYTQAGSSLLEVLVAVLILAVGMLGIAALQAVTLRNTGSAAERSNAVIQSYAMLDMMRANRNAALAGDYDQNWLCEAPDGGTQASDDIGRWIDQLQASMGSSACGRITCGPDECEVGVQWNDSRGTGDKDALEKAEIITVSRI